MSSSADNTSRFVRLPLSRLKQNTGQIDGLPSNPRQWTQTDIDRIARSLRETPELFDARPIIVYPCGENYVILGGNLRYAGCVQNGDTDAPCFVVSAGTPQEKLREIVIKDNGSFGAWDFDELANSWDDLPLADWGVPSWPAPENAFQGEGSSLGEQKKGEEDDFDEKEDGILVRCKPGDVWVLGDHRLVCGDSTDLEVVKAALGGAKADMVFTDPPYGVAIGDKNKMLYEVVGGERITESLVNDTLPD